MSNPKDLRYCAKVRFLNFNKYGLLDTEANISCMGADLAAFDFSGFPGYTKCKHFVKMATHKRFVDGCMWKSSLENNLGH